MIKRFYVHNFKCLENFELPVSGLPSALLIGKNGSGKTTVSLALEILQKIARGTNRVRDLVKPMDLARARSDVPMRFEIEVEIKGKSYNYTLAFEFPEGFKELRVLEEELTVDGNPVYHRERAKVYLANPPPRSMRISWSTGIWWLSRSFNRSRRRIPCLSLSSGSPVCSSFVRCLV